MRTMTLATPAILAAMMIATSPAGGEERETAAEPPAPQQAAASTEAAPAQQAAADEKFRIPPGFREKKRGKHVVYCRKETSIGTRFETEKCYDEQGLRDMLRAQQEDQAMVDKTRRICAGQGASCGGT